MVPERGRCQRVLGWLQCNCRNSKCLKLYCECFASGLYCTPECRCRNCCNSTHQEEARKAAIETTLYRNPKAFKPKIGDSKVWTSPWHRWAHQRAAADMAFGGGPSSAGGRSGRGPCPSPHPSSQGLSLQQVTLPQALLRVLPGVAPGPRPLPAYPAPSPTLWVAPTSRCSDLVVCGRRGYLAEATASAAIVQTNPRVQHLSWPAPKHRRARTAKVSGGLQLGCLTAFRSGMWSRCM